MVFVRRTATMKRSSALAPRVFVAAPLPRSKPLSKADIDRHFRGLRTGETEGGAKAVLGRSGAVQAGHDTSATPPAAATGPSGPASTAQLDSTHGESSAPAHTSAPAGSPSVHASQRRSSSPSRQGGGARHAQPPPHAAVPVFSDMERQRFDLLLMRLRCVPHGSTLEEGSIVREFFGDDFVSLPVHKVHAETGLTVLAVAMHYQLHKVIQAALAHPGIATTINLPMPALPGTVPDSEVPLPPLLLAILHRVPFLTRQLLAAGASPHVRHPITHDTALHLACIGFPQPDVKRKKSTKRKRRRATQQQQLLPQDAEVHETPVMRIPSTAAASGPGQGGHSEGKSEEGGLSDANAPSDELPESKHQDAEEEQPEEDNSAVDAATLAVTPPHKVIEALLYAVSSRRPQARRAYLNRSNSQGMTALHTALDLAFATGSVSEDGTVVPGDVSNAAALLAAGASALVRDPRSGMTAWQRIVALGSVPLAATALEHGSAPMLSEHVLRRQLQQWWCRGTLFLHGRSTRSAGESKYDTEDQGGHGAEGKDEEVHGAGRAAHLPEAVVQELVRLNRAGQVDTLRWHLVIWRHAKQQQALHAEGVSQMSLSGYGVVTVRTNGGSPYRGSAAATSASPGRTRGRSRGRSRSPRGGAVGGGSKNRTVRSAPLHHADEFASMQTLDLSVNADMGGVSVDQPLPTRSSTLELSSTSSSARGAAAQAHQRSAPGERPSTVHVAQRGSARGFGRSTSPRAAKSGRGSPRSRGGGSSSQQGFKDKKSMTVRLRPAQEKAMSLLLPSMSKGVCATKGGKGGAGKTSKGGPGGTAFGAGGIANRILTSSRSSSRKSHSTLGRSGSRATPHAASGGVGGVSSSSGVVLQSAGQHTDQKEEHKEVGQVTEPFAETMPDFNATTPEPPSEPVEGGPSEGKHGGDDSADDEQYDDEWAA